MTVRGKIAQSPREPACLDATPDASRLVAAANPRLQQEAFMNNAG